MKKLLVLIVVLTMFGAACKSDTTLDIGAASDPVDTSDASEADNTESGDAGSDDANDGDDGSTTAGTESTPAPPATTAPTEVAPTVAPEPDEPDPTAVPAATPTSAPYAPTAEQRASIQAVVDADDWCEAADAVENGTAALDDLDFTDPVELEAGFRTSVAVITASRRLVPPAIAADVDQAIEAFTELGAALEDAKWSFLDLDLALIDEFDAPMEVATYNIELYNFTECGIGTDPGEPPTVDPGGATTDPLPTEGTIREQAVAGLVAAGFTVEESECILSKLDLSDPEAFTDTTAVFSVFTECGISLDRLAQLGG